LHFLEYSMEYSSTTSVKEGLPDATGFEREYDSAMQSPVTVFGVATKTSASETASIHWAQAVGY